MESNCVSYKARNKSILKIVIIGLIVLTQFHLVIAQDFGVKNTVIEDFSAGDFWLTDIDGDGDEDVLSANTDVGEISWAANDGLGNFDTPQVIIDGVINLIPIQIGDVDNDGDVDVFFAVHSVNQRLAMLRNNGDGSFGVEEVISIDVSIVTDIEAEDLNQDGFIDVLTTDVSGDIIWYQNDGSGNFGAQQFLIFSNGSYSISSDIDGDNDLDIVTQSSTFGELVWLENNGLGSFLNSHIVVNASGSHRASYACDLDNDGDNDVLSFVDTMTGLLWYENDGLGNFGAGQLIVSGVYCHYIYATDIDLDDDLDVFIGSAQEPNSWFQNEGFGQFSARQIVPNSEEGAETILITDIDGNGSRDLISGSTDNGVIAWFDNREIPHATLVGDITNCITSNLIKLAGLVVTVENEVTNDRFSGITDSLGEFEIEVDTGEYRVLLETLDASPYSTAWIFDYCDGGNYYVPNYGDTDTIPLIASTITSCEVLSVDLSTPFIKPCEEIRYDVRYCNFGTEPSIVIIDVELDPFYSYVGEDIDQEHTVFIVDLSNIRFIFNQDTIQPGECKTFSFDVFVDCDSTFVGQTHCVTAVISPHTPCNQPRSAMG